MELNPLEIVQGQLPEIVNLDSNSETVSNVRSDTTNAESVVDNPLEFDGNEDIHTAGLKIIKSPCKKNS